MIPSTTSRAEFQQDGYVDSNISYGGRPVIGITFRNEGAATVIINDTTTLLANTAEIITMPYPYYDCSRYAFRFTGAGAQKLVVVAQTVDPKFKTIGPSL